jgi:hypothetical protein
VDRPTPGFDPAGPVDPAAADAARAWLRQRDAYFADPAGPAEPGDQEAPWTAALAVLLAGGGAAPRAEAEPRVRRHARI